MPDESENRPTESRAKPDPSNRVTAVETAGIFRQTVEFLVLLSLSILIFRTFAAEAYVVPTGSMAPTLLGLHYDVECPNCKYRFVLGMDEAGRSGRPTCPNCGQWEIPEDASTPCNGDRLLVQKHLFDVRKPRRWEVAVFQSPREGNQAYVKRVVGLPGESVRIHRGDIEIDGKLARKSLDEQRAMRVLVYDHNFIPKDSDRFPRWAFRSGRFRAARPSGWEARERAFVQGRTEDKQGPSDLIDWLEYRHWAADLGKYGPVQDYYSYNGAEYRGENTVDDLMLDASLAVRPSARDVVVRLNHGSDALLVTLPVDGRERPSARLNGRSLEVENPRGALESSPASSPRFAKLEVSVIDRQLLVALNGKLMFDPIPFESAPSGRAPFASPLGLGVLGSGMEVRDLKLYRDIYYTSGPGRLARPAFGVDEPYVLGKNEYFVLGDNSPVSNDSRFWPNSPAVRGEMLLGKPFLVHLPGQMFTLRVFGRPIWWIPDPREIRYIR